MKSRETEMWAEGGLASKGLEEKSIEKHGKKVGAHWDATKGGSHRGFGEMLLRGGGKGGVRLTEKKAVAQQCMEGWRCVESALTVPTQGERAGGSRRDTKMADQTVGNRDKARDGEEETTAPHNASGKGPRDLDTSVRKAIKGGGRAYVEAGMTA